MRTPGRLGTSVRPEGDAIGSMVSQQGRLQALLGHGKRDGRASHRGVGDQLHELQLPAVALANVELLENIAHQQNP